MKLVFVLFLLVLANLLFLSETFLEENDEFKCTCVEEAENGNMNINVGFYFIAMLTDGSKYKCGSDIIEKTKSSNKLGRRQKIPTEALEVRQENGKGTGIQSSTLTLETVKGEENAYKSELYRINKKRYVAMSGEETNKTKLYVVSILAQDDDFNTGYVLEAHCHVTEGKTHLALKSRKPKLGEKVIRMVKNKAKELGIGIELVHHDKSCKNEKWIWSDLQKKLNN